MPQPSQSGLLLRASLFANAAFSAGSGLVMLLVAPTLADWLGTDAPWLLQVLGGGLLLYAGWLLLSLRPALPDPRDVRTAIALDLGWVLGSAIVLAAYWPGLTTAGRWSIGLTADLVAAFALLQWYGLHRAIAPGREARTETDSSQGRMA